MNPSNVEKMITVDNQSSLGIINHNEKDESNPDAQLIMSVALCRVSLTSPIRYENILYFETFILKLCNQQNLQDDSLRYKFISKEAMINIECSFLAHRIPHCDDLRYELLKRQLLQMSQTGLFPRNIRCIPYCPCQNCWKYQDYY